MANIQFMNLAPKVPKGVQHSLCYYSLCHDIMCLFELTDPHMVHRNRIGGSNLDISLRTVASLK